MHRDDEIDKELRFHLDERVDELVAGGMPRDEAHRRAQLEFGGLTQANEMTREHAASWAGSLASLWQDVRYSVRRLWASPGFAGAVIATIALGIGVNTAIFTIVNSVLLKPLPVPDADRIVLMANRYPNVGSPDSESATTSAAPDYYDRLQYMTVYDEQAMYDDISVPFNINGVPMPVPGVIATPSFFRVLRVPPAHGRVFDERDGEPSNQRQIILSDAFAQELFGSAGASIGKTIQLANPFTVIGVMPPGFEFANPNTRFWIPLGFSARQKSDKERHSNDFRNIARLKPDATIAQAQAQVDALNAALVERFPQWKKILADAGFFTRVERVQDVLVRNVRSTLYLVWGGALLVLLISGVNVANMTLARSNARAKELATRLALGAGWPRVVRLLIVEGLLLALAGGLGGTALG